MTETIVDSKKCFIYGNENAEKCLIQPVDKHDLALLDNEAAAIEKMTDVPFVLAAFLIEDWNRELSPWDAPAVFGKEDFGSGAEDTLAYITDSLISYINALFKKRFDFFVGGYSLAGLFSLWAGYQTDVFCGIAGVSPSVWFPKWDDYIASHRMKAQRTYLSLGDREEKTKNRVMATVGDRIRLQYERLTNECILEWNRGNHFVDSDIRTAKGFSWLLR